MPRRHCSRSIIVRCKKVNLIENLTECEDLLIGDKMQASLRSSTLINLIARKKTTCESLDTSSSLLKVFGEINLVLMLY